MARLLILEDDTEFAEQLTLDLEERGHDVALFPTASEALAYSNDHPFDLVIADLHVKKDGRLTKDGGITLISQLRQIRNLDVPIIAMSGSFSNQSSEVFKGAVSTVGANAVLSKPFFPDALAETIDKLLSRRR